jgi:hypothetical protein
MNKASLLVTSDLSPGASSENALAHLADQMGERNPAAVVIAGNLGETLRELESVLDLFKKKLGCPLAFLPGNQDLFFQEDLTSQNLWTHALRKKVESLGVRYLQTSTLEVGSTVISGSIGWYDYSSAIPELGRTQEYWIQSKLEHNVPDALRIDWEWSDLEFATLVSRSLSATLDSLESDPKTREVVVVTHFPVFEWQLSPVFTGLGKDSYPRVLRAYQGNLNLGLEILQRSKVRHVVSGHVGIDGYRSVPKPDGTLVKSFLTGSSPAAPSFVEVPL